MDFFTSTINNWQPLLNHKETKLIILRSFQWFHENKEAVIHGFVIMPNHIHLLWSHPEELQRVKNESRLLSYTGHLFREWYQKNKSMVKHNFFSTQADRTLHFWERRSRTIEMESRKIAEQKLDYIHENPLQPKWKLAVRPEDYYYSSARFYTENKRIFPFLTHYMEYI